jgi:hypothetical protein
MKTNAHKDMITKMMLVSDTENTDQWRYFTSSRDG